MIAHPKPVDIARIILNARVFNPRSPDVAEGDLTQAVNDLLDTLEAQQVDYLLVGGIALLAYVAGRNTEDIDLILSLSDLDVLDELIVSEQDQNFARATFHGLRVDVLLTQNQLFDHVRRHCATTVEFVGRAVPCSTVEGLLLLKFYALPSLYRRGDFDRVALYETDIAMLLRHYPVDVPALFDLLKKHLPESDIQSLQEIHGDIEKRIRRFRSE